MTLKDVVRELIRRLGDDVDTTIPWEQVRKWPKGAVDTLQEAGWIKPTDLAETVECPGCEENCFMPVNVFPAQDEHPIHAFVACEERNIGRVKIPLARLQQWRLAQGQVARWIAAKLGLHEKPEKDGMNGTYKLGTMQGKERVGLVELDTADPVSLQVSAHSLLLTEAISVENNELVIDRNAVLGLVVLPPLSESPAGAKNTRKGKTNLPVASPLVVFWSMAGLKFKEINIRIDPEKLVLRFSARGKEAAAPFSAIGITKKNEVTLNRQGEMFMAMANGTFNAEMSGANRAISRLSTSLREAFHTPDQPFRANRPEFRLSIPKDKDAHQRGIKRTVTFDDSRKARVNMDAQAFLQTHDPDYDPDQATYADDPDLGAGD